MIEKIVTAVTAQLKKYLKPQMNNIDTKLDRINNRISNVESYMELQQMVRGYELSLSKFDNDISDILKPKQTLKKPTQQNRRQGL